jgi:hypothetical protein
MVAARHERAPDFPLGPLFAAALHVGLREFDKARGPLEVAHRFAPELVQARLTARPAGSGTEFQQPNGVFLRITAGLEEPSAVDALRQEPSRLLAT